MKYEKLEAKDSNYFVEELLLWYHKNKRELPWRKTKDPYKIWLSEIILQQTRVAQGLPYYLEFVRNFPTVKSLASASEDDVLLIWQGLGYYSRARNLYACAQTVAKELGGIFPTTSKELLKLKGIGTYTAAAIASIAFDESVPVVDGNVYRVLSRVWGIEHDIASPAGAKYFRAVAASLIPQEDPGSYNQALMEFGALHCTPQKPQCLRCPLKAICVAYQSNRQNVLPVNNKKVKIRSRFFYYFILQYNGQVFVKKRTQQDIWKGLYDFYLVESEHNLQGIHQLENPLIPLLEKHGLKPLRESKQYKHVLTHQRLNIAFFDVNLSEAFMNEGRDWLQDAGFIACNEDELMSIPKPVLIKKFLNDRKCNPSSTQLHLALEDG